LPPFIFELFLAEKIESGEANKVTFGANQVTLTLTKKEPGLEWRSIEEAGLDKEQKHQWRRNAEIEEQNWHKNRDAHIKGEKILQNFLNLS